MVSIDFFGAQEPRMKKITPSSASKTQRNSALEKLARKAEEAERAQAQAQGTLIQVPQASAIKSEYFFSLSLLTNILVLQLPQSQASPVPTQTGKIKIVNRKLGGSLSDETPAPTTPQPPITPTVPVDESKRNCFKIFFLGDHDLVYSSILETYKVQLKIHPLPQKRNPV